MKTILKIVLFFSLITSLYAKIDEYKSDVYYANGVLINVSELDAEEIWKNKVEELFVNNHEASKKN